MNALKILAIFLVKYNRPRLIFTPGIECLSPLFIAIYKIWPGFHLKKYDVVSTYIGLHFWELNFENYIVVSS